MSAQHRMNQDLCVTGQLNNIEQAYTMILGVRGKGFSGKKPINLEFIRSLLEQEPFQYHRSPVRDSSCVYT